MLLGKRAYAFRNRPHGERAWPADLRGACLYRASKCRPRAFDARLKELTDEHPAFAWLRNRKARWVKSQFNVRIKHLAHNGGYLRHATVRGLAEKVNSVGPGVGRRPVFCYGALVSFPVTKFFVPYATTAEMAEEALSEICKGLRHRTLGASNGTPLPNHFSSRSWCQGSFLRRRGGQGHHALAGTFRPCVSNCRNHPPHVHSYGKKGRPYWRSNHGRL